jgi:hypothetical protein
MQAFVIYFDWAMYDMSMDKSQLTGCLQGPVYNFKCDRVHVIQLHCFETKLPNLKLKTRPKQLLVSVLLGYYAP